MKGKFSSSTYMERRELAYTVKRVNCNMSEK